jgi:4,5-epoxidase
MRHVAVIVVGAGPTGLVLACDLKKRGIDVIVVDRLDGPARAFRALGLQPRGRQILERLDAIGDLSSKTPTAGAYRIFLDQRRVVELDLDALGGPNDNGVLRLPQTEIEHCLRQRLRELGVLVDWSAEITRVSEDGDGLTVCVRRQLGEEAIRANWLVGCDGAHSTIRNFVGATLEGNTFPEPFMVADVTLSEEPQKGPGLYLRRNYVVAVAPLPGGQWRIGGSLPKDHPLASIARKKLTADTGRVNAVSAQQLETLRELYASLSGDRRTSFLDCSWFAVFSIHRRTATAFRRGRIFIAGDAAHLSSPLGGQGMNSGIADAFNLGWKLALVCQGRADSRLLDTYEAERRPATEKIERATTQWTRLLLGEGYLNQLLRRYAIIPALRFPSFLGWAMTRRPALRSSYRNGPLAFPRLLLSRGPQPGDEAPDVRCARADGIETSIGREIGPRWGLLFFGDWQAAFEECATAAKSRLGSELSTLRIGFRPKSSGADVRGPVLIESNRAIRDSYRAESGTTILVRPDGYIACRVNPPDPRQLASWLDKTARVSDGADSRSG